MDVKVKGFIKAEVVQSQSGVGSLGNIYSHVATTRALNTDAGATEQEKAYLSSSATSIQTAQSRFSLTATEGDLKTVIEFDLLDGESGFTNQTAIQNQEPRVRLATIYYNLSEEFTVFAGQKWNTASGNKAVGSFNFVGNGFQAGNTGFLAQEFGLSYDKNNLSLTGAISGKGKNKDANGVNNNELDSNPGIALDANYKINNFKFGLAHISAELAFESEKNYVSGDNVTASLSKFYLDYKTSEFRIFGEYYLGNSISNLNALGIAPGTSGGTVSRNYFESGYWLSAKYNMNKKSSFTIGHGTAEVDSEQQNI